MLRLVLFIAAVTVLRLRFQVDFPGFMTLDSPDYILAASGFARLFDLSTEALGAWRLPGYPVFLALVGHLTAFTSDSIVLSQVFLGIAAVVVGLGIGRVLHSRLVAELLVLFLGLSPVYLLNEHLVMAETVFLFTLVVFALLASMCLRRAASWPLGVALGTTVAACVLTRSNGLFFCGPVMAAVVWIQWVTPRRAARAAEPRATGAKFLLGFAIAGLVVGGPWVWRNQQLYGTFTPFTKNFNRNLLIYHSQHDLLDPSLPAIRAFRPAWNPKIHSVYMLIVRLGPNDDDAERRARAIVLEQTADHPERYLAEVGNALANFAGYAAPRPGLNDVATWFENVVNRVAYLNAVNRDLAGGLAHTRFAYVSRAGDTWLTRAVSEAGTLYLGTIRPGIFSLFALCLGAHAYRRRFRVEQPNDVAIGMFGGAWIVTALAHSLTLSDYDRFAAPFDWVMVLVIGLVAASATRELGRHGADSSRSD